MADRGEVKRYQLIVQGVVQGVNLRWQVRQKAIELGLVGWVANEADITLLTIEIEGQAKLLASFIAWLKFNPGAARIDRLTIRPQTPRQEKSFKIKNQTFWLV